VQLEDDRPFREVETHVLVGTLDRQDVPGRRAVQEASLQRSPLRLVPDHVERLPGVGERAFDEIVVVRRQDEQLWLSARPQQLRHAGEKAVQ
jgi:hypothetical protein